MLLSFWILSCVVAAARAENRDYNQGQFTPNFLNYCYDNRRECVDVCGCMLARKCMVRPMPTVVRILVRDIHNEARLQRLKATPTAAGMPSLLYDNQLEQVSACWAAKCFANYTKCMVTDNYDAVGMNYGLIRMEDMDMSFFNESPYNYTKPLMELWRVILQEWALGIEKLNFDKPIEESDPGFMGAQMIHDKTFALGCSWSASPFGTYFFCAYGQGLEDGSMIYDIGPPCSKCPAGMKCPKNAKDTLCVKYALRETEKPHSDEDFDDGDIHDDMTDRYIPPSPHHIPTRYTNPDWFRPTPPPRRRSSFANNLIPRFELLFSAIILAVLYVR